MDGRALSVGLDGGSEKGLMGGFDWDSDRGIIRGFRLFHFLSGLEGLLLRLV